MKIKVQTRKLAAGCSKHCFKVVDGTDEVSSKHCFEVVDGTDEVSSKHCFKVVDGTDEVSSKHCFEVVDGTDEVSSKHCFEVVDRTDEVSNHIYGKVKLTWFEEIFEEYKSPHNKTHTIKVFMYCPPKVRQKKSNFWGAVHFNT
ncbi:chlorohydrolase [Streptococcus pneumoniae]|nr:chlorohydrolase [Streptococcus pneumoniae]VQZ75978.1 chlorohydrolase [Streptococcus pneumoniae]